MIGKTKFTDSLKGLTLAEARDKIKSAGYTFRVMNRDGVPYVGTCDFKPNRVNLSVNNDKITKARMG